MSRTTVKYFIYVFSNGKNIRDARSLFAYSERHAKKLCVTKNNMDIAIPTATIQMLIPHFHFFVSSRLSFFTYHDGYGKIGKPAKSLP